LERWTERATLELFTYARARTHDPRMKHMKQPEIPSPSDISSAAYLLSDAADEKLRDVLTWAHDPMRAVEVNLERETAARWMRVAAWLRSHLTAR
jgi:hypothetical protein